MSAPSDVNDELFAALARSRDLGFLGPGDIETHVRHARAFIPMIPAGATVLDLGSGGGLPGFVIAAERTDVRLVLVDAMEKRVAFLRDVLRHATWSDRVTAECGRAEELAHRADLRGHFDRVVVRSFGPPAATAECAVGFLSDGGEVLVSEPEDGRERWPEAGLAILGLVDAGVVESDHARIQRLRRVGTLDDRYPRKVGMPVKRPLFDTV